MKDTVIVMGSHPRTRAEFDWTRTDCDLWVFNEAFKTPTNHGFATRADAVFQLHAPVIFRNPGNRNDPHHYEWLKSGDTPPIYMQEKYEDIPNSVRYPLEEIVERFHIRYLTSTPSYALALACYLGYKRIEIYGLEMASNTEYQYQRDGVALWIGVALGLGIEVDAHIALFDQPLYGYEGAVTVSEIAFDERIAELTKDVERLTGAFQAAMINIKGAVETLIAGGSKENEEAAYRAVQAQIKAARDLGMLDGALQENKRYQGKAAKMKETAGSYAFSRQEFESAVANLTKQGDDAHTIFIARGTELGIAQKNLMSAARGSPKRKAIAETYRTAMQRYLQAANKEALYRGAARESMQYMNYLDKHIRAAGGAKSEALMLAELENANA